MTAAKIFWIAGLTGHILLFSVLYATNRLRRFPFFGLLILFYILRSLALYVLYGPLSQARYIGLYWSLALTDLILQLLVLGSLYKIAAKAGRFPLRTTLLGWLIAVVLATIGVFFLGPWPSMVAFGKDMEDNWKLILPLLTGKGNLFICMLALLMWIAFAFTRRHTNLGWNSHPRCILNGMAIYSLSNLSVPLLTQFHPGPISANLNASMAYGRTALYFLVVIYWMVTLWMDETPSSELQLAAELQTEPPLEATSTSEDPSQPPRNE